MGPDPPSWMATSTATITAANALNLTVNANGGYGGSGSTAAALNDLLASAGGAVGDLPSPSPEDAEKLGNRQERQLFFARCATIPACGGVR